ncbi:hypothetical protein [Nocardioides montaniterrae]
MNQPRYDDDNPVKAGLVALIGVSLAVGLVLAIIALIATHFLGLSGGGGSSSGSGGGATMYIPPLQKTTEAQGPLVTLNTAQPPRSRTSAPAGESEPTESAPPTKKPGKGEISLQALETTVPNFGKIDLTGTYPGGEGQILQVQRQQDGAWVDFAATVPVVNSTLTTYIQTGVSGKNTFRVLDKSRGVFSNPVTVTVQ